MLASILLGLHSRFSQRSQFRMEAPSRLTFDFKKEVGLISLGRCLWLKVVPKEPWYGAVWPWQAEEVQLWMQFARVASVTASQRAPCTQLPCRMNFECQPCMSSPVSKVEPQSRSVKAFAWPEHYLTRTLARRHDVPSRQ